MIELSANLWYSSLQSDKANILLNVLFRQFHIVCTLLLVATTGAAMKEVIAVGGCYKGQPVVIRWTVATGKLLEFILLCNNTPLRREADMDA